MKGRRLATIMATAVILVVGVSVAEVALQQTPSPAMATVAFFSNNTKGYACFLNYTYPLTGAPVCLSDDPSLDLPDNATMPLGNYAIAFFPFGTSSNKATWLSTNNIQVTGSGPYDVSSSYANITVRGNGAIAVFVLQDNGQPIPEFNAIGVVVFSALAASVYVLRRRRR
jgi:hypothetical protein